LLSSTSTTTLYIVDVTFAFHERKKKLVLFVEK
jgi:hypothetical protein